MRDLTEIPLGLAVEECIEAAAMVHFRPDLTNMTARKAEIEDIKRRLLERIHQAGPIYG